MITETQKKFRRLEKLMYFWGGFAKLWFIASDERYKKYYLKQMMRVKREMDQLGYFCSELSPITTVYRWTNTEIPKDFPRIFLND